MSIDHGDEHEQVLQKVGCGDLSPLDPSVVQLERECETCRNTLRTHDELMDVLVGARATLKRDVESSLAAITEQDRDAAARALNAVWSQEKPRAWPPWAWLLGAAALVTTLLMVGWRLRGADAELGVGHSPEWMGTSDSRLLTPTGLLAAGQSFVDFSWEAELGSGETFTLLVWNVGDVDPVIRVERLRESSWSGQPEDLEELGARIRWQVVQSDFAGDTIDVFEGWSERQP